MDGAECLIFVKRLTGETTWIRIDGLETILQVKQAIEDKDPALVVARQRLIFCGCELDDTCLVGDCKLTHQTTIHLVMDDHSPKTAQQVEDLKMETSDVDSYASMSCSTRAAETETAHATTQTLDCSREVVGKTLVHVSTVVEASTERSDSQLLWRLLQAQSASLLQKLQTPRTSCDASVQGTLVNILGAAHALCEGMQQKSSEKERVFVAI